MALPEWLGNLYNLQTLKLSSCRKLTVLPSGMQNLVNLHILDIHGTTLKEMPRGMGKLTQLQHLSLYIVGKHEENGMKELGGLSNLHGSLSIRELENVGNGSEASEAKIMDKKYISQLSLTWSSADNCFDSQTEMDILCKLQPHQDLQLLEIDGYRGARFPDWVGNPSYHNMTDIKLSSCKNCFMLPSLGQLPSLKNLSISCLDALVTIDACFYKNNDSSLLTPFPFLESLILKNMPCWEGWSPIEPDAFPKLKTLEIKNCPKLRGDLPSHLPFLESLILEDMSCWKVWSPIEPDAFPKLKCLKIEHCPKLKGDLPSHLPALEDLEIIGCTELASSLPRASAIHSLTIVESYKVALQELPLSIESLDIERSPMDWSSVISLFAGGCLPESLKRLCISNFRKLEFPNKHKSLESLDISCDSLTSLPLENFPNLGYLSITSCKNLEYLSASQDCVVRKLRAICITNSEKLLSDPAWPSMEMLTYLDIYGPCDGIKSFPKEGLLPSSLTSLRLYDFSSLETLDCKGLLHLTSLQSLTILSCPKLENIAGERLPASLTNFSIFACLLLKERCCQKHPQIWPKISHVHDIDVDWETIS